jgi:hypothetical protein
MPKGPHPLPGGRCTSVMSQSGPNPLIVSSEGALMKNIQHVLREKEAEIEKLNREIKLLRVAARILDEEGESQSVRADSIQRHADMAAVSLEEPMLDVLPVAGPANGDSSKRWP